MLCASTWTSAEVTVKDAWVRGMVAAQKSTGAFLTLTSSEDAKLVAVSSAVAKSTEIHHSEMSNNVMHMHAVDAIVLPAGKAVELKPGGHHLMLMGVSKPVKEGDKVPLTLTIEDRHGKKSRVEVEAGVRPLGR
ncbi:MAG TPA: copper chaperone PCu(A)C [Usitatibacter sp.]|nr:copper chaperone PCu(A)C [Usitatibacter sp.]